MSISFNVIFCVPPSGIASRSTPVFSTRSQPPCLERASRVFLQGAEHSRAPPLMFQLDLHASRERGTRCSDGGRAPFPMQLPALQRARKFYSSESAPTASPLLPATPPRRVRYFSSIFGGPATKWDGREAEGIRSGIWPKPLMEVRSGRVGRVGEVLNGATPPPINPARRRHSIIFWKRLGQGYDASEGTRARRVLRALTSRRSLRDVRLRRYARARTERVNRVPGTVLVAAAPSTPPCDAKIVLFSLRTGDSHCAVPISSEPDEIPRPATLGFDGSGIPGEDFEVGRGAGGQRQGAAAAAGAWVDGSARVGILMRQAPMVLGGDGPLLRAIAPHGTLKAKLLTFIAASTVHERRIPGGSEQVCLRSGNPENLGELSDSRHVQDTSTARASEAAALRLIICDPCLTVRTRCGRKTHFLFEMTRDEFFPTFDQFMAKYCKGPTVSLRHEKAEGIRTRRMKQERSIPQ
ncbi:hypothetical protein FB451DRAFT_1190069 [Mycena latifolia]|nr:hypothetical protein FB451DRAFT_1190069 [Mycena latifolia]